LDRQLVSILSFTYRLRCQPSGIACARQVPEFVMPALVAGIHVFIIDWQ